MGTTIRFSLLAALVGAWLASVAEAQVACPFCGSTVGCGCFGQTVEGDEEVPVSEFRTLTSWSSTATDPSVFRGNPVTLTWGFVRDGTRITGQEGTSPSDLIAMLDSQYGTASGSLENRPWFSLFEDSFNRWGEVSGVTYLYEPNDGGAALNANTTPIGQLGVYADVRIGGHSIDGDDGPNVLAYNYFPNHSDMVIDTDNAAFFGNDFNNSLRLRNTLMHEAGHGLGLNHLDSGNSRQLMEPRIDLTFDGPQIDDILGIQRSYGDAWEKNGGNDSFDAAVEAGGLGMYDAWKIGADADFTDPGVEIMPDQVDFISIDDRTDIDFFRFKAGARGLVDLRVKPVGPTYQEGAPNGTQSPFNTAAQSRLAITVYDAFGNVLASDFNGSYGEASEVVDLAVTPGQELFARVTGIDSRAQLYRLDAALNPAPRESTLIDLSGFSLDGANLFATEIEGVSVSIRSRGGSGASLTQRDDGVGVFSGGDGGSTGNGLFQVDGDYATPEELLLTFSDDIRLDNLQITGLDEGGFESVVLKFLSGENPFLGLTGYDDAAYSHDDTSITFTSPHWQSAVANFAFGVNGQSPLKIKSGTTLSLTTSGAVGGGVALRSLSAALVPEPAAVLLLAVAAGLAPGRRRGVPGRGWLTGDQAVCDKRE